MACKQGGPMVVFATNSAFKSPRSGARKHFTEVTPARVNASNVDKGKRVPTSNTSCVAASGGIVMSGLDSRYTSPLSPRIRMKKGTQEPDSGDCSIAVPVRKIYAASRPHAATEATTGSCGVGYCTVDNDTKPQSIAIFPHAYAESRPTATPPRSERVHIPVPQGRAESPSGRCHAKGPASSAVWIDNLPEDRTSPSRRRIPNLQGNPDEDGRWFQRTRKGAGQPSTPSTGVGFGLITTDLSQEDASTRTGRRLHPARHTSPGVAARINCADQLTPQPVRCDSPSTSRRHLEVPSRSQTPPSRRSQNWSSSTPAASFLHFADPQPARGKRCTSPARTQSLWVY
eukprot:NODE_596_length_1516_cov_88.907294_g439_i0.p1 GENE.NODE_596_length_1516_cov_88.907294_g439_i0~~NODE_596_length_1516_cov_88.907294_g439_i0.p1  ORF type:complete len:343 (+),score=18.80 NODE_596_length_1516_cov_88.907294_g439_i0:100-1128(+)